MNRTPFDILRVTGRVALADATRPKHKLARVVQMLVGLRASSPALLQVLSNRRELLQRGFKVRGDVRSDHLGRG